jgi:glycerate kinase
VLPAPEPPVDCFGFWRFKLDISRRVVWCRKAVGLEAAMENADLSLPAEGKLDHLDVMGKRTTVAGAAKKHGAR